VRRDSKLKETSGGIDALEFVLNVLVEHEKELDRLIGKLEQLLKKMDTDKKLKNNYRRKSTQD
jgi:uncharacterized coiled-coil protein SlyX